MRHISETGQRVGTTLEVRARDMAVTLLDLQARLSRQLRRLQAAERRLSRRASLERAEGGRRVIRLIERERQRLGRQLHTELGQLLAAIRMQLEVVDHRLPDPPPGVREALEKVARLSQEALNQVRSIARRIHPPEWQRLRLDDALRQLWKISGVEERFQARLQIDALAADPCIEVKSLIYRAVQEGLANVMRHAQAHSLELVLQARDNLMRMRLRDDGVGFDVNCLQSQQADLASGIGLRAIREEAAELNGKLLITSGALGTTLEVSVPLTPALP